MYYFKKILEGTSIEAQLKKEFPEVIFRLFGPKPPEDGENGYYYLQMILVPYKMRNKGIATKFMKRLQELATKEKHDIFLTPDDAYQEPGEMTKNDIMKWYKKLGFEKKHKDDFRMKELMCFYVK